MNFSHPKHFYSVVTALACSAFLLSSCSKKPTNNVLIGKWQVDGQKATIEFKSDGTLTGTDEGEAESGKYKFTDASHMQMEIIDLDQRNGDDTNNMPTSVTMDCEVKVQDNDNVDLTISMKMPGNDTPKNKDTAHLKRIK